MEHRNGTSDISLTVNTTKATDLCIQSVRGARNVSEKDDECHAKRTSEGKPETQLSTLKDDYNPNSYSPEHPSELNKG